MGAHGIGLFDDDDGADFTAEILRSDNFDIIISALRIPQEDFEFVDQTDGMHALLAAELVASQRGYPGEDLPDEMQLWAEQFGEPEPEVVDLARLAVARVVRCSETRELWKGSKSFDDWLARVGDLSDRLQ